MRLMRLEKRSSIAKNLTLWFALCLSLMVLCASLFLYHSLKRNLYLEDETILNDRLQAIVSILERSNDPIETLKKRVESEWALRRFEKIYVRVTDRDLKIITETPNTPDWVKGSALRPEFVRAFLASRPSPVRVQISPTGVPILVLAMEVKELESKKSWNVYVAMDLEVEQKLLARYEWRMFFTLIIALIVSIFVGRFIANKGLKPIALMTNELSQIQSLELHGRLSTDLPIELMALGMAFNGLLDRIQESMRKLSQFSADIAHEIRTPINNLRGEIEVSLSKCRTVEEYQDVLGSCLEECSRMKSVVDSLLFLARSEHDIHLPKGSEIDVEEELKKIAEFYEVSAEEAGVTLIVTVEESLKLCAERALFQTAVSNLLSNALRYTETGGRVEIDGRSGENDSVIIEVRDNGLGISPEHLPYVFDRLYRADRQRTSTSKENFGLGLAIVQAIMNLHRGSVSISSAEGKGTAVSLKFGQGH